MSQINSIEKKIKNNQYVFGCSVTFSDSSITELLGDVGFDFIWIDMEHTPNGSLQVKHHIMAARGTDSATFVRVPGHDDKFVKPIIDIGPDGIIFPFINSAEDAKKAVSICRYPPEGDRGFGPQRAARYGLISSENYISNSDKNMWKIMQIEHVEAVNNLEDILETDGVDSFVVGPNDLAGSLDLIGQTNHKEVKKYMDLIAEKAAHFNIPYGVAIPFDLKLIEEWLERGAQWIEIAGDFLFLADRAKDVLQQATNFTENWR